MSKNHHLNSSFDGSSYISFIYHHLQNSQQDPPRGPYRHPPLGLPQARTLGHSQVTKQWMRHPQDLADPQQQSHHQHALGLEHILAKVVPALAPQARPLQKLVSRLAILSVDTPPEDLNVKFLRSLPSEWDTHVDEGKKVLIENWKEDYQAPRSMTHKFGIKSSSKARMAIQKTWLSWHSQILRSYKELKQPEVNVYGLRDSSVMPITSCDKESDNSKENTDDSLKQQHTSDSSLVKSPFKIWVSDDEEVVEHSLRIERKLLLHTANRRFVNLQNQLEGQFRSVNTWIVPFDTARLLGQGDLMLLSPQHVGFGDLSNPMSNSQLNEKGFVDSGCSRHMSGNIAHLSDFKEFDGGYVTFGGGANGGRITGKGTIKTDKLDFEDVYFVKELKFNLFSVSQMCDKKNYVLFTDSECLVLFPNFKLPDENQILLKIPRQDNMYSFDMKNIVPKDGLTCLVAKATSEESMLWHRRLGHVNFKNINKLVKENLVRDLPLKRFENDQTCVACLKDKQHRASCKTKTFCPITKPLFMLHMDLFDPTFVSSLMHKKHCLVVTDDYSRFSWVFFLRTKDETSEILKNFIKEVENLVDKKVKIIGSDNGTEFKNKVMDELCRKKGIKREYSVARTPQQNGVAERKNRTLIEAARTMLANSKLPTTFWAEAVSTTCYVQNRVLIVKPHNKTPYELFRDPDHPDKVYKVMKALYGLHQAPRAWYDTLATYLLSNGFQRGQIDQTLFIKSQQGHILLVQIYVDDIIFGSTKKELCAEFEKLMKDKFQMSSMGELTFFLGLQVQQRKKGIFISQDKYVYEIPRKFNYIDVKSASTPTDLEKPLVKDADADDVDEHLYRSMIGSLICILKHLDQIYFCICACAKVSGFPPKTFPSFKLSRRIFSIPQRQNHLRSFGILKEFSLELVAYTLVTMLELQLDREVNTTGVVNFGK
ncbi:putative ribonuclease H-like domain-containing protein [Tanacetum coccineum]|uniref:Ribonuclease H-like domain-containing protein n=1 Tax=Tanacetum coccineum TaxID=301880 RepID=A0ABQ5EQD0_9ASTR